MNSKAATVVRNWERSVPATLPRGCPLQYRGGGEYGFGLERQRYRSDGFGRNRIQCNRRGILPEVAPPGVKDSEPLPSLENL